MSLIKDNPSEYGSWTSARQRCRNPNNPNYPLYGGRGIKFCKRWDSFEAFLQDMGKRPANHSLERINNNHGYTKKNCKWALPQEQAANRCNVKVMTHNGITTTIKAWSLITGIKADTISQRLERGWTVQDALTLPTTRSKKQPARNDPYPDCYYQDVKRATRRRF